MNNEKYETDRYMITVEEFYRGIRATIESDEHRQRVIKLLTKSDQPLIARTLIDQSMASPSFVAHSKDVNITYEEDDLAKAVRALINCANTPAPTVDFSKVNIVSLGGATAPPGLLAFLASAQKSNVPPKSLNENSDDYDVRSGPK